MALSSLCGIRASVHRVFTYSCVIYKFLCELSTLIFMFVVRHVIAMSNEAAHEANTMFEKALALEPFTNSAFVNRSGTPVNMASSFSPQSTQGTRGNTSLFLEKAKAGIRRSTPDSEALASSDDEQDHRPQHPILQQVPRPHRRASWLSEMHQGTPRKGSLPGNFSSMGSHPNTPATEPTSWPSSMQPQGSSTVGRSHSNSTSFPWGGTIWTNDAQKGPPSRLSEVMPSPTTVLPTGSSSFFGDGPAPRRDSATDSSIPFAIPLHPTPKTYRSQSYSVGQLDPELTNVYPTTVQHPPSGRARVGSYAGVPRRASRPSMLGDFSHDSPVLEQLREVDDDEESATSSEAGVQVSNTQARTIEQLAMENAILRQQAAMNQLAVENAGYVSNGAANLSARRGGRTLQQQMSESVLDEPEQVQEMSIPQDFNQYGAIGRRYNELNANSGSQFSVTGAPENRKLESVKKGQWQSSLGFGGLAEIPQSRRHSFADVPTRHGSMSSAGDVQNSHLNEVRGLSGYIEGTTQQSQGDSGKYARFRIHSRMAEHSLEQEHLRNRKFAASYFSNPDPSLRSPDLYRTSNSPSSMNLQYGMQAPHGRNQHSSHSHGHGQLLYVVTFKACRAEFYYVQEGTGLQVNVGDLVIVEADRGTDLGTVALDNIDWASAKDIKDHYAEEHYKWLMMFSRHGQNGSVPASNPNALPSSSGVHASAIGGVGPPGQTAQDMPNAEIKPKMIKRLAQSHEIQTLKDKEGNEAKAKRMCQQKVAEHHLNMEILDAEFQM